MQNNPTRPLFSILTPAAPTGTFVLCDLRLSHDQESPIFRAHFRRALPENASPARRWQRRFNTTPISASRQTIAPASPTSENAEVADIQGAHIPIIQVGISWVFACLLHYLTGDIANRFPLETSVTGTVSLPAEQKGINMSRIMRGFYEFKDRVFTPALLGSKKSCSATNRTSVVLAGVCV